MGLGEPRGPPPQRLSIPAAQAQAPAPLPAPAQRPLTSAGERQAPRGPRTPSHGAGSREPGSALLWLPRPRRSSGPRGPSADAHRPGGGQPGGRSLRLWVAPPQGGTREEGCSPTASHPIRFLSLRVDTNQDLR